MTVEATYPDAVHFEVYISGAWEDIAADVLATPAPTCKYGINGNTYNDRVASPGQFRFTLRDDEWNTAGLEGYYSPYRTNRKAGWDVGIKFRYRVEYQGGSYTRFYGRITKITPPPDVRVKKTVDVVASDWMEYASNQSVVLPTLQTNKKIEEVVPLLVAMMPVAPLATAYGTGVDTFPTVFDTVRLNTRVLSEFQKLAVSEMGYIYLQHDPDQHEVLVVEGRDDRSSSSTVTTVPVPAASSGHILQENGDDLLLEDGGYLLLDEVQDLYINNHMTGISVVYGDNILNNVKAKTYPRRYDAANVILYSLPNEIALSPGETKTIKGQYRDPNNTAQKTNGMNMVNPVATTDYTMNATSGGGGADLTASLTVTATYGTEAVQYELTNAHPTDTGYITKLQARGIGVYTYDPVEYDATDSTSEDTHGYLGITLDMKYQDQPETGVSIATSVMNREKDPRLQVRSVTMNANSGDLQMRAFLYVNVGSLIHLNDDLTGVNGYYYVQGVQFTTGAGGSINYTWYLTDQASLIGASWDLGMVGFSELDATTIVGL